MVSSQTIVLFIIWMERRVIIFFSAALLDLSLEKSGGYVCAHSDLLPSFVLRDRSVVALKLIDILELAAVCPDRSKRGSKRPVCIYSTIYPDLSYLTDVFFPDNSLKYRHHLHRLVLYLSSRQNQAGVFRRHVTRHKLLILRKKERKKERKKSY